MVLKGKQEAAQPEISLRGRTNPKAFLAWLNGTRLEELESRQQLGTVLRILNSESVGFSIEWCLHLLWSAFFRPRSSCLEVV